LVSLYLSEKLNHAMAAKAAKDSAPPFASCYPTTQGQRYIKDVYENTTAKYQNS
jgi:hypothetical protein